MSYYNNKNKILAMVIKRNELIDDEKLSEKSSFIHLLDRHDIDSI